MVDRLCKNFSHLFWSASSIRLHFWHCVRARRRSQNSETLGPASWDEWI